MPNQNQNLGWLLITLSNYEFLTMDSDTGEPAGDEVGRYFFELFSIP